MEGLDHVGGALADLDLFACAGVIFANEGTRLEGTSTGVGDDAVDDAVEGVTDVDAFVLEDGDLARRQEVVVLDHRDQGPFERHHQGRPQERGGVGQDPVKDFWVSLRHLVALSASCRAARPISVMWAGSVDAGTQFLTDQCHFVQGPPREVGEQARIGVIGICKCQNVCGSRCKSRVYR